MKKFARVTILAAAAIGFSGAAMAADVYRPPIAPKPIVAIPQAFNWNGWYLGAQGGWDTNNMTSPGPFASTANGGIAGAYTGFNMSLGGSLVWGIDASINWTNATATASTPASVPFNAGPNWKGFLRGRVGLPVNRLLLYGTAGGAVMGYNASCAAIDCGTASSASATPWGWTAGAGIDWAVTNNLIARFDWAYQNYGTFTINGTGAFNGTSVSATSNTFTLGLAMKF